MAKQAKNQNDALVETAKKNGAILDLGMIGAQEDFDTVLEDEIRRGRIGTWFKLMPGETATIRFFAWKNGIKIPVHQKFNVIQGKIVCPKVTGHGCEYCSRSNAEELTRVHYVWEIYWYEVGKRLLFEFADNRTTPVSDLLGYEKKFAKAKGGPRTWADFDCSITQEKEGQERSFTLLPDQMSPFDFSLLKGVPPLTQEQLAYKYIALRSPHLLGLETKSTNGDEENGVGLPELDQLDVFGS